MNVEILNKLYSNPEILTYLRYNPEWYKILYYEPEKYKEFETEAKESLKISTYHKIEDLKNNISFIQAIIDYARK